MKTIHQFGVIAPTVLALASLASAQTTYAGLNIGGPGSYSSEGFDDPGLLNDGITPASADYTFQFTPNGVPTTGGTLVLIVDNTSPVYLGINNPVLSDVYFNAPSQVTGMSLTSQVGQGGATPTLPEVVPAFNFQFDPDPAANGAIPADGFGRFSVGLTMNGHASAIANPAADTIIGTYSLSVEFRFNVTGDMTGITAEHFVSTLSAPPPPERRGYGAAKFQAGGNAQASAFISDDHDELLVDLLWFRGIVRPNHTVLLGWRTASELDNLGFNVYVQPWTPVLPESMSILATQVNSQLILAQGSAFMGATYTLEASQIHRKSYYWLEDVDVFGISTIHGPFVLR